MTEQRRLAAIVSADVAGYSRLMGRDETGTLAALKALRQEVVDPTIAAHGGRIVKTTGDGLLLEFPSVVNAVRCSIEVQAAMADRTTGIAEDRRIAFRIGINIGDIIAEGDDIFGDGVNVAARLQEIAPPGGICISSRVHEDVRDRLDTAFDDGGSQTLKNIARPVQVWRWLPGPMGTPEQAPPPTALPLPDKPSIAVLPFQNMSGDPEQEYFVDGLVEDIITALSRFKSLFVIARNSSFAYKGKSPDIREVGRELGVRYVLEGSVRRAGGRARVTAQLIEAATGAHIWAERYDRSLEDVFAVQEELTEAIVIAIAPEIESTEKTAVMRRPSANPTAYELATRAAGLVWSAFERADSAMIDRVIADAQQAIAIDPESVRAHQVLAQAYGARLFLDHQGDRESLLREALAAATRAIELDRADPMGLAIRAMAIFMSGAVERYQEALADVRLAHESNPNDPYVLFTLAHMEVRVGEPDRALERGALLLRLNPRGERRASVYNLMSFASFAAERYAEGVEWSLRALHEIPNLAQSHSNMVICLVGQGEIERARAAFATANALAPGYFRPRLEGRSFYQRPQDRERQTRFLRIAAGVADAPKVDNRT
jgi:adenylate cyclase